MGRAWQRHSAQRSAQRPAISFRAINRRGDPEYDPSLQRHHLLPRELLKRNCFSRMFDHIDRRQVGFDDFRRNGLLLPATESSVLRIGMPLHRGPHRNYNAMVIERVGSIELSWSEDRLTDPREAMEDALFRLSLLQNALRKRLLSERRRLTLNRKDPLGTGFDFTTLDAMAEELWNAS